MSALDNVGPASWMPDSTTHVKVVSLFFQNTKHKTVNCNRLGN